MPGPRDRFVALQQGVAESGLRPARSTARPAGLRAARLQAASFSRRCGSFALIA
jgi:hypothetical protein